MKAIAELSSKKKKQNVEQLTRLGQYKPESEWSLILLMMLNCMPPIARLRSSSRVYQRHFTAKLYEN